MTDWTVLEHTPEGTVMAIRASLALPGGGAVEASYRVIVHLLLPVADHVVRKPQNMEAIAGMARLPIEDHLRKTAALFASGMGVLGPAHSTRRRPPLIRLLSRLQLVRRSPHGQTT